MPDRISELDVYRSVLSTAKDLETRVCGHSSGVGAVAAFADDMFNRFALKRRQRILSQCRQLVRAVAAFGT